MDALAFLDKTTKSKRQPIIVLSGDEEFLKKQCKDTIRDNVLGDVDPEFALSTYNGDKLEFSTIRNELDTMPFLAPCRLVLIEPADKFVTEHRPLLERYAEKPSSIGVLVLDVKSFPETTKLAKLIPEAAKISCKAPPEYKLPEWCMAWAKKRFAKTLDSDSANLLIERVGLHLGVLAAEIEKLATVVAERPKIEAADIEAFVGRSREGDVFRILDLIGSNQPREAITVLEQLLDEGEDPLAILGPMTYQLRKLAAVARLNSEGLSFLAALDAAGIPKWPKARDAAQAQITHLGLRRLRALPDGLVDLNFGLKGGDPLPARIQLERWMTRLARPREVKRTN
ncbi:MAG: DNA polymerase III subunit delta [Gemmataceae bacterium]